MGHTVLSVGDLVQYEAFLAGWLNAKITGTEKRTSIVGSETWVTLRLTMRERTGGYNPGEVITVRGTTVLPRKGWHRSRGNPFRVYHTPGWCLVWESCASCGREIAPVSGDAATVALPA